MWMWGHGPGWDRPRKEQRWRGGAASLILAGTSSSLAGSLFPDPQGALSRVWLWGTDRRGKDRERCRGKGEQERRATKV